MINSVGALKVKRKSNATKETSGTYRMQERIYSTINTKDIN